MCRLTASALTGAEGVATSQSCDVLAAAQLDTRRMLVLLGSDDKYRVTTYTDGDREFGPGYYFADEAEACRAFGDRLAETSAA